MPVAVTRIRRVWAVGIALLCATLVSEGTARAAVIQLGSQQDASIADNIGNDGDDVYFFINWAGAASSYGLIQFDVSAIPSSATILSASLDLYHRFNSGDGKTYDFFANTSSWSEATVTYATRPTTAGGSVSSLTINDDFTGVHRLFDLTAVTQSWVDGSLANFGLTLIQSPDDPNWIYFASKESQDESWRPLLTINYRVDTQQVPEPVTVLMLMTGLGGVALRRARTRRSR